MIRHAVHLLVASLLGCPAGPIPGDPTKDGGAGFDTGSAGVPGEPLGPTASWVSADPGVATGLGWADINGDGLADLVVAYGNDIEPGPVAVYENMGGSLPTEPTWRSSGDAFHGHLALGDLNGDGRPDLAVSRFLGQGGFSQPGGVDIYLNEGGQLGAVPAWQADGFFSFSLALGDVDLDGDLDLAVAVGEAYENDPAPSRLFENDGGGGFTEIWTTERPRHSFDVGWHDMDGDGWPDLVFANHGDPHSVYLNQGGSLPAAPSLEVEGSDFSGNSLDAGDLDGDGHLDLAVSDNNQMGGTGSVRAWCGPDLHLCWEQAQPQAYPSAVSLHDVDGDGWLDLATGAWWGAVWLHMGGGVDDLPETTPSWRSTKEDIVVEALAWGDVDGDGWQELAVSDWTLGEGNRLYTR